MADKKEYPEWFIHLMQDMLDMRDAQRDYFQSPNQYKLKVSKAKEAKADQHLQSFIKEGIILQKAKQVTGDNELFK